MRLARTSGSRSFTSAPLGSLRPPGAVLQSPTMKPCYTTLTCLAKVWTVYVLESGSSTRNRPPISQYLSLRLLLQRCTVVQSVALTSPWLFECVCAFAPTVLSWQSDLIHVHTQMDDRCACKFALFEVLLWNKSVRNCPTYQYREEICCSQQVTCCHDQV